jgi:predicted transglutaminase-like cysteine proteinase
MALWCAANSVRGQVSARPDAKLDDAFAYQSDLSSGAKYQLGLFVFLSLLLCLAPISVVAVRGGTSVVAKRLAVDGAPWGQNILPSPLSVSDGAIFVLPRPIGTAMANFIEDRLLQRDRSEGASASGGRLEQPAVIQDIALLIANRFPEFNPEIARSDRQLNVMSGRQIGSGAVISHSGYPSLAPMGYVRFCLRHIEDCETQGNDFRRRTVALTRVRWAQLDYVNREVNRDIISQPYGVESADWLLHPTIGSCHDYAVTKRHDLLARGWPSSALLLSEAVITSGEHHLVLVVRTNRGNFVLDNLDQEIRRIETVNYRWVRIQSKSNPKFWLSALPEERWIRYPST